MRGKTAGGAGVRSGSQRLTAKRATVGVSCVGQPCICLHISFLSRARVCHTRLPAARKGKTRHRRIISWLILRTGQPSFTPNKRPYTSFSDRTGDNVDKSTVLRKNFHSSGVSLEKRDMLGQPARRREAMRRIVRDKPGDWHKYCIVVSDRGDRDRPFRFTRLGFACIPGYHTLVASEEAVKEMEIDGSHCEKGI